MKNKKCVIIILILVIVILLLLVKLQNKENSKQPLLENNNIANNSINENLTEINESEELDEPEELDFESDIVQKIYPFTGAFPSNDLGYLAKIKNINKENITNEFILRIGFSKVTKEDWASTYTAEGEPVSIKENLLKEYIEDIFGDIEYKNENFSNYDLSIKDSKTSLYKNVYNSNNNTYTIRTIAGDGVGDSYIEPLYTKALKYDDKIELEIYPIYIENLGQHQTEDGEYKFLYKAYKTFDYEKQEFKDELTGTIEESLYKEIINPTDPIEYIEEIKNIKEEQLEKYTITYKLNEENNEYEFESLKFEE